MEYKNLDFNILKLQLEITKNAAEIVRLHRVIEDETRQVLEMQAQRDEETGFRVNAMNSEVQMTMSYHGGKLHGAE